MSTSKNVIHVNFDGRRFTETIGKAFMAGFKQGFADSEAIDVSFRELPPEISQEKQGGENMC